MSETILLVDYENVGRVDLNAIPPGVRVPFFFGASQKSVPTEFLKAALKLGDRFLPIDIEGQGKNALDFHIAFYLGEYLTQSSRSVCVILSKDKGFDPLIKHLKVRGFHVRRAVTLGEAFPAPPSPVVAKVKVPAKQVAAKPIAQDPFVLTLEWLKKLPKKNLPRKRKGLVAHIFTHYGKKIPEDKVEGFIDQLIAQGKIRELNGAVTYVD